MVSAVIHTARLLLRRQRVDDASAVDQAFARDPEVTRYLTWRPNQSVADSEQHIRERIEAWDAGRLFAWAIVTLADDRLIGAIELRTEGHRAEVGYVLARSEWSQGYMSEALTAVVAEAFRNPAIWRVWAVCDVDNPASARVMEKAGLTREGILRRWTIHPNISAEPRDVFCYSRVRG